jgi:hypothetical protein
MWQQVDVVSQQTVLLARRIDMEVGIGLGSALSTGTVGTGSLVLGNRDWLTGRC